MTHIPGMKEKLYTALRPDIMVARITDTDGGDVRGIIIMIMVITGTEAHTMRDGSMIPAI